MTYVFLTEVTFGITSVSCLIPFREVVIDASSSFKCGEKGNPPSRYSFFSSASASAPGAASAAGVASAASAASALHVAIMPVNPPLTQGEKKIERGERDRESLAGEG